MAHLAGGAEAGGIDVVDPEEALGIGAGSDILVVDDDATNLVAYQAALEPLGRRLVVAHSGDDAIAKLLDNDFALMLLDVAMPGMTGIETARLVRQRPRNRGMPIIFITGESSSPELIVEAYDIGACDFLIKPILPDILRAKTRVYLQLQQRTRALLTYAAQLRDAQKQADERTAAVAGHDSPEQTARRLEKLQEAMSGLATAKTPADVAAVTVRIGLDAVEAKTSMLWLARADGTLALAAQQGFSDQALGPYRAVVADSSLAPARVLQSGVAMWVEDEEMSRRESSAPDDLSPAIDGVRAHAVLPLRAHGTTFGVVDFGYDTTHRFSDGERRFLSALAVASEHALERSRLYEAELEARRVADAARLHKDELLGMLGHELRNPLAAMVSAVDLIKLRDGALTRELAVVERQLGHLTVIVNDLVNVARVTQGELELRRSSVVLADAIADAVQSARTVLEQHQHALVVYVPEDLVLDADRDHIALVLAHLVTNAAKYTPGKGRIDIAAERLETGMARIVVRDNGIGITEPLLSQLFEPFVEGKQPIDRNLGGLGIGLTLVRRLVELHGGSIDVQSDGPGAGTTFSVFWPLAS